MATDKQKEPTVKDLAPKQPDTEEMKAVKGGLEPVNGGPRKRSEPIND